MYRKCSYTKHKQTNNIKNTKIERNNREDNHNDQWATEIANLIESWCYAG